MNSRLSTSSTQSEELLPVPPSQMSTASKHTDEPMPAQTEGIIP